MLRSVFRLFARSRSVALLLPMVVALFCLPGCGWFQGAEEDDESLADLDTDKKSDQHVADTASGSKSVPEGELELKLKVGDQFPLIKRIEQRLMQTEGKAMIASQMIIELVLALRVDDIREDDGRRLLTVYYQKVRYNSEIAGKRVEYDSDTSPHPPVEVLAYAGLKGNYFSFWIGPDNRVIELVGFDDFLKRCLRDVPFDCITEVMRQLDRTRSDEGLANFVDDGIGLLPYSDNPRHPAVVVRPGSSWDLKPRRLEGVVPMEITTHCTIKNMTETTAEIGLMGNILGNNRPMEIMQGSNRLNVQFKGGQCSGFCIIDRRTGLPTQSKVDRFVEMVLTLPNGMEITQHKDIITTISSFPQQAGSQLMTSGSGWDANSNRGSMPSNYYDNSSSPNRVTQTSGAPSGR